MDRCSLFQEIRQVLHNNNTSIIVVADNAGDKRPAQKFISICFTLQNGATLRPPRLLFFSQMIKFLKTLIILILVRVIPVYNSLPIKYKAG